MKRKGMVSPSKAARMLDVHQNTVYSWCQKAVRGEPSRLKEVEQNPVTGYYYVSVSEIRTLKDK